MTSYFVKMPVNDFDFIETHTFLPLLRLPRFKAITNGYKQYLGRKR